MENGTRTKLLMCLILSSVIAGMVTGCASVPTVDQATLDAYKPETVPGADETVVYVFRQSAFLGAAVTISVGVNDQWIADLGSGSYCMTKIAAGVVTLTLSQGSIPVFFLNLDDRPGEIVYVYLEYTKGKTYEIPQEQAVPMILNFTQKENFDEEKPNPAYATAMINPGLMKIDPMVPSADSMKPDADTAVITFVRASDFAEAFAVGIWNSDGFLGDLKGKKYFQVRVPPGKHTFFGKGEHWSVLEATVDAGKEYFVQVTYTMGWSQGHVRLLPVTAETDQDTLDEWIGGSERIKLDETKITEAVSKRLSAALPLIEAAKQKVEDETIEKRILAVGDSR